jgi:hypothetical protein
MAKVEIVIKDEQDLPDEGDSSWWTLDEPSDKREPSWAEDLEIKVDQDKKSILEFLFRK